MMDKFINHTSYETQDQQLETLGFAVGKQVKYQNKSGYHQVQAIIIPDQVVTKRSCEASTQGSIELIDYMDKKGFITLGMIHTHPTQENVPSAPDCHALHTLDQSHPNIFSCIYSGVLIFIH